VLCSQRLFHWLVRVLQFPGNAEIQQLDGRRGWKANLRKLFVSA
jgi:hypothetical protein